MNKILQILHNGAWTRVYQGLEVPFGSAAARHPVFQEMPYAKRVEATCMLLRTSCFASYQGMLRMISHRDQSTAEWSRRKIRVLFACLNMSWCGRSLSEYLCRSAQSGPPTESWMRGAVDSTRTQIRVWPAFRLWCRGPSRIKTLGEPPMFWFRIC